jgi:putative membrane protein
MKKLTHHDEALEMEVEYNRTLEIVLLVILGLLMAGHLGVIGYRMTVSKLPFQLMTYTFTSVILVHAGYMLGWRRALAFFALAFSISLAFEHVGVKTGLIFGHYHYTDVLDPKLFGTVPLVIPLAYFMVIYPSYMIANFITRGRPAGSLPGLSGLLLSSLLTALVMSAWDLTMDPVMVYDVKAWVWERGGQYFQIPFRNFIGWVITTFTVSLAYRAVERLQRMPMKPFGRAHRTFLLMPLAGYASLCIGDLWVGVPVDTRVIAPFAMGIPLVAALIRLYGPVDSTRFERK